VLAVLVALRGRAAAALAAAGAAAAFLLVGMWSFVLNVHHTGHLLGRGTEVKQWTASPSYPGTIQTALHVLYRTFDLSAFSYRFVYSLAGIGGVVAAVVALHAYPRRGLRRSLVVAAGVGIPFLAPLLTIGGADALASLTARGGIPVHEGGWAGGLNRGAIEDSSAFGPVGAVFLLAVPVVAACMYLARRADLRHLALGLALPTFLILLALQSKWNPWLTRFLLVPAALTAPLLAWWFRSRAAAAALVVAASLTVGMTLENNHRKPLESPFGFPWQLSWSHALKPQGHGPFVGVLDDFDRLVPARACVGAIVGPDEPSYLLYGPKLEHHVVYLPVESALLEAYRHHLFYVVVSTGVDSWAATGFTKNRWKPSKLGDYWLLLVSPAPGAGTGDCFAA
jgi:hypothetical protein